MPNVPSATRPRNAPVPNMTAPSPFKSRNMTLPENRRSNDDVAMICSAPSSPTLDDRHLASGLRQTTRVSGTSVSLLTYCGPSNIPQGMTITTANVLSMAPPSMLIVVRHVASSFAVLEQTGRFCINLISAADLGLVDIFSRPDDAESRFAEGDWRRGWGELPYLETALSSIFCETEATHDYGSQRVFFGRIREIRVNDSVDLGAPDPLVWLNGRPGRVVYSLTDGHDPKSPQP